MFKKNIRGLNQKLRPVEFFEITHKKNADLAILRLFFAIRQILESWPEAAGGPRT